MPYHHISVMPDEVATYLDCKAGGTYADCTLGGCGHARRICRESSPGGTLIGIDRDRDAIENAKTALQSFSAHIHLFHGNYTKLPMFMDQAGIDGLDGILLDLGLSMNQLENSGRGFSFQRDEPLDMRMNTAGTTTAADMVNRLSEKELAAIFKNLGEEPRARAVARRLVYRRKQEKIETSRQLADLVVSVLGQQGRHGKKRIHPATRVFMALRIAVNRELECLRSFLDSAVDLLNSGGRICILSFHSLEDRIVKRRFRELASDCTCPPDFPQCVCDKKAEVRILTRKPVRPTAEEIERNPPSRSTLLRAAEKL